MQGKKRPKNTPSGERTAHSMNEKNPPPHLNELAERIGGFIEYWGFKKIHGIIWTHLYLSPSPLSAGDLIARLKISKALASLSLGELIHYRLIEQTPECADRKTKYYRAVPEVFVAIKNILETRETPMLREIQSRFDTLHTKAPEGSLSKERLEDLGRMIEGANEGLRNLLLLASVDPSFLSNILSQK